MISLLYPKEEKRKLTELLFTLQKLRLDAKMCAGSEKCRHIRNSYRLFTGRKGNIHGKKSSDQVFHETIHAVPGF